ncbi:hypothetical protein [Streptomyces barringtoniae]|nr:hypothetical protein [Streptomyces barringtoniae]
MDLMHRAVKVLCRGPVCVSATALLSAVVLLQTLLGWLGIG